MCAFLEPNFFVTESLNVHERGVQNKINGHENPNYMHNRHDEIDRCQWISKRNTARNTTLCFYQIVLTLADLILAGSANPKISAEPIRVLSKEISADPSRISWANRDQCPFTLKLFPFDFVLLINTQKCIYSNKYYNKTKTENLYHLHNRQYQTDVIWSTLINGVIFPLGVYACHSLMTQTIIVMSQQYRREHSHSNY